MNFKIKGAEKISTKIYKVELDNNTKLTRIKDEGILVNDKLAKEKITRAKKFKNR